MKKQKIEYRELWQEYNDCQNEQEKIEIRNKIIELYYPLIVKLSYKMAQKINWKMQPEELSSFGVDGIYSAIKNFDMDKGVKFKNYASTRIYGAMLDGIRKEDIIPRSVRTNNTLFEKTKDRLESMKGRNVTEEEVIKQMGVSQEKYLKKYKYFHPKLFTSLNGSNLNIDDDYNENYSDALEDKNSFTPDSKLRRKEFFNKLMSNDFSQEERIIVYYYYYKNYTMEMIAEKLNFSESRVSQIHRNILPRLKDKILRNPKYFSQSIFGYISDCNNSEILF